MPWITLALQASLLAVLLRRGFWRRVPWFIAAVASMALETPFFPHGFYWFESVSAPLRIAAVIEVVWILCMTRRNRVEGWIALAASILLPGFIVEKLYRAEVQANLSHPVFVRSEGLLFTLCAISAFCASMYCWWSPSSKTPRWSRFHAWILCGYMAVKSLFSFSRPIDLSHWQWMSGLNRSIGFIVLAFWIACFWPDPSDANGEYHPCQKKNLTHIGYLVQGVVHGYPSTLSLLAASPRRIMSFILSRS